MPRKKPFRVLFVGNSFIFVHDLPGLLVHVSKSLGRDVQVANSTTGGCTLYAQTAASSARTAALLHERWDAIVLQEYSALPLVAKARDKYLRPAIRAFRARARGARVVLLLHQPYDARTTHADGGACPSSDVPRCFPRGPLPQMTQPSCQRFEAYRQLQAADCMGYALTRAHLNALGGAHGVDAVAPGGLAYQIVRGARAPPPKACRAAVDAEYAGAPPPLWWCCADGGGPLARPNLPLHIRYGNAAVDKHPNAAAQYLAALTLYTTLFGASPRGAALPPAPRPVWLAGPAMWSAAEAAVSAADAEAMQGAAALAVDLCGAECGLASSVNRTALERALYARPTRLEMYKYID